jgi:hypothetical protein
MKTTATVTPCQPWSRLEMEQFNPINKFILKDRQNLRVASTIVAYAARTPPTEGKA